MVFRLEGGSLDWLRPFVVPVLRRPAKASPILCLIDLPRLRLFAKPGLVSPSLCVKTGMATTSPSSSSSPDRSNLAGAKGGR